MGEVKGIIHFSRADGDGKMGVTERIAVGSCSVEALPGKAS